MDRLRLLEAGLRVFDASLPDVTPPLCLATRYRSSSCRRCLDACPAAAITPSPWLELDAKSCRSCGACAAVCRTGALAFAARSDMLRAEFQARAAADPATVTLVCRCVDPTSADGAPIVVPCLGGVSARDLIAAASLGIEQLHLISGDCPECPDAAAEAALDLAVATADETLDALHSQWIVARRRLPDCKPKAVPSSHTVSRRGLLAYIMRGLGRTAAEGIAAPEQERSVATLHKQVAPPDAHGLLLSDLAKLESRLAGSPVTLPASLPLADVNVSSACDACGLCLKYCPHGALTLKSEVPTTDYGRCTGCGLCAEVCPRAAVIVGPAKMPLLPMQETARRSPAAMQNGQTTAATAFRG